MVSTAAAFRLEAGSDDVWREALADIAGNLPVTRYAVHVSPDDIAVVVFGRMEAKLIRSRAASGPANRSGSAVRSPPVMRARAST